MKSLCLLFLFILLSAISFAQKGIIKGRIYNVKTNQSIESATITIQGTTISSFSDLNGNYIFTGVEPGFKRVVVSSIGFETTISPEFQVQGNQIT
ncbi:MAG: carboxypeptidase-like regulatory domain-containing protein, partial [Bacteroidales bacterium]|nr:carboxypeptidase-like regulatory domain-containing protein [Bacteroidales bacterium]MDD4713027.1 carboxypeptidase-like regulatory domain-containing protein [Bacteroidales bacterium]